MRDSDEEQIRIDLAATFRIIAHLGMHEAVANHFSAALSADGKTFLLNPKWKHFFAHPRQRSAGAERR